MNHHHGVGTRLVLGNLILHEHLADHERSLVDLDVASRDRKHALVRDFERPVRVEQAILRNHLEIARSAAARLMEEYYKILRTGASAAVFRTAACATDFRPGRTSATRLSRT